MGIPSKTFSPEQLSRAGMATSAKRRPRLDGAGPEMNKLERDYAQHLELLKRVGQIRLYLFGALSLRLASGAWYRSDFLVEWSDGRVELHETKGFMREDSRLKLKWAAKDFPWPVIVVRRGKGGKWDLQRVIY